MIQKAKKRRAKNSTNEYNNDPQAVGDLNESVAMPRREDAAPRLSEARSTSEAVGNWHSTKLINDLSSPDRYTTSNFVYSGAAAFYPRVSNRASSFFVYILVILANIYQVGTAKRTQLTGRHTRYMQCAMQYLRKRGIRCVCRPNHARWSYMPTGMECIQDSRASTSQAWWH